MIKFFCIAGALLCQPSAHYIDGPLAYASPANSSYAWTYAAYSYVPTRPPLLVIARR